MATITGENLYLRWVYSGGTVVLSTDYTQFTFTPSVELLDESAGADTHRTYIPRLKDSTASYAGRHQASGTALVQALAAGTEGTLEWGEEGTAAGKPKKTLPAISQGASINIPYANLVDISCTFQGNGEDVDATW